ncbi:WAT1-related protein At1g25270-like [Vicia villosa]|uniref:WAT1-related protein At1g25270-like n=1 Tax=Vicia villosa TaxID=3911 RepID=UPI00273C74C2|nr:WAT1-related protein At1g25270-like [Vicia villosa]
MNFLHQCQNTGSGEESLSHLFFSCNVTICIWRRVFMWLELSGFLSFEEFGDFFYNFRKIPCIVKRTIVGTVWLATVWSIWLKRNAVIFENEVFSFTECMSDIVLSSWSLERLNIGTLIGKAKVVGTIMGISGAMVLTFYKSVEIHLWSTHVNLLKHHPQSQNVSSNNIWGSSLALGTCLSYSIWLIIQARMSEKFPWHYTSTALMSVMASIQSIIFALCMERGDWNQWKLGWDIKLFTALFAGVVVSGINWILISWCVRIKGPLYASVFNPLFLVLVAIGGSLLLDEKLYLGSVIGSLIIVIGLYIVLWGKSKELKKVIEQNQVKESVEIQPMEIITAKLEDATNVETGNNDIKSSGVKEITIKNYDA